VYLTEKSGFAAVLEILGAGRYDPGRAKKMAWDTFYPYIVGIVVEKEGFIRVESTVKKGKNGEALTIPTANRILDELEFITDSGAGSKGNPRWNLFLYPSLVRIPETDYRAIASRLDEAPSLGLWR